MLIDADLVRRLVASQFPQWAHLPIEPVASGGWDNRTFHLGDEMSVRLPSAEGYALQVQKEQQWLPFLGPQLPLPVPTPLALGRPQHGYLWNWSIYRWQIGSVADSHAIADLVRFAADLARFLGALQRLDPTGGPPPGAHNGFRGAPVGFYDADVRRSLCLLPAGWDSRRLLQIWEAAVDAPGWERPVWFHGDITTSNLLTEEGHLAAVIDFGCCGVGDPACDLAIAWTLFSGQSRHTFRTTLEVDSATWARGRGWALWKALITLSGNAVGESASAHRVLNALLAERVGERAANRRWDDEQHRETRPDER